MEHDGTQQESERQRVNRELIELLNELRVALPGVQVLFAFLLTIPFARGWSTTTRTQRDLYAVALASATVAIILLMAPGAYARILFRHADKELLIRHANRLAIAGMIALAVALAVSLLLITDYVFDGVLAGIASGLVFGLVAVLWYGIPLWIRLTK
jgi:hypothetical protein